MSLTLHAGYLPGAIGRITELHARFSSALVQFGLPFESKVARELAEFCERYEAGRDGLWLLLQDGRVEGSIAIDGLHAAAEGAHLRWFICSDELRGQGWGKTLLATALDFCRQRRYPTVQLWTFEGLDAARRLYDSAGFRLVQDQRGSRWGREVREQQFELRTGARP